MKSLTTERGLGTEIWILKSDDLVAKKNFPALFSRIYSVLQYLTSFFIWKIGNPDSPWMCSSLSFIVSFKMFLGNCLCNWDLFILDFFIWSSDVYFAILIGNIYRQGMFVGFIDWKKRNHEKVRCTGINVYWLMGSSVFPVTGDSRYVRFYMVRRLNTY